MKVNEALSLSVTAMASVICLKQQGQEIPGNIEDYEQAVRVVMAEISKNNQIISAIVEIAEAAANFDNSGGE